MSRALLLILWGWTVLWSWGSGRLDLLLRNVFHGLVAAAGLTMVATGLLMLFQRRPRREGRRREDVRRRKDIRRWKDVASASMALMILVIPPEPSFSDLASNRPEGLPQAPELAFVLPPEQRTLTEWVRVLRSQADPNLVNGNPVNISGFVWRQPDAPPLLARLTVRCCLADATPAGLPVAWPENNEPEPDAWLAIRGQMEVRMVQGEATAVVVPDTIQAIPRPQRPLEP